MQRQLKTTKFGRHKRAAQPNKHTNPSRVYHPTLHEHTSVLSTTKRNWLRMLNLRTWREGLLELVGLVGVEDANGVEVAGAAHLELDGVLGPLDPHRSRVLAPRRQQEVLVPRG